MAEQERAGERCCRKRRGGAGTRMSTDLRTQPGGGCTTYLFASTRSGRDPFSQGRDGKIQTEASE